MPEGSGTLAGIGDEAAVGLSGQTAAIRRLGWSGIELRTVGGAAIADLGAEDVERVRRSVDEAGLGVVSLASRIGNWARPITSPFADDMRELDVLAAHGDALGTRGVRVMSYPNDGLPEHAWRDRVLDRMSRLAARARELGLVLLHENCAGWAGSDGSRMVQLAELGGPALRLLFDTGNGVEHGYDPRDLLDRVLPHVAHVHVKDAVGSAGAVSYVPPGAGRCRVAECLRALFAAGYSGPLSLEPHLSVRPHENVWAAESWVAEGCAAEGWAAESGADRFVSAGRALERVLAGVLTEDAASPGRA